MRKSIEKCVVEVRHYYISQEEDINLDLGCNISMYLADKLNVQYTEECNPYLFGLIYGGDITFEVDPDLESEFIEAFEKMEIDEDDFYKFAKYNQETVEFLKERSFTIG